MDRRYNIILCIPPYHSIMNHLYYFPNHTHYSTINISDLFQVGVTNGNNDAMTALKEEWHNQPAMGQRKAMSAKDAHLLNKLYCMPGMRYGTASFLICYADCSDRMSWCGLWANDGHCEKSFRSMEYHCKKSCDLCPTDAQRKS